MSDRKTSDRTEGRSAGNRCVDRLRPGDRTVIVGAGPAGLTAGLMLARQGRGVCVLEADDTLGGIARTEKYDGYRFDIGGHRFFTKIQPVQRLWEELLGDGVAGTSVSRTSMAQGLQLGDLMPAHQPKIAVVIPCLDEVSTIETVVRDFRQALPEARIHVIDNGSTDRTAAVAAQAGADVIFEPRRGKGNAIRRIVRSIDADVYVMVDGDSTYPADQVMELVSPILKDEADMVVGDRISNQSYQDSNTRRLHSFGNRLVCGLVNRLYGTDVRDVMSGYRAFSRRSLENMPVLSEGFEVETEMTLHALDRRYRLLEVPIRYEERPEGSHSKLRTYADGMLVLRTIASVAKNYKPLYFFSWIAAISAAAGLVIGTPVLIEYVRFQYIYKVPSAILASSLILLAMLSFTCGLILDTVVRHHRESYELELNRLGPHT